MKTGLLMRALARLIRARLPWLGALLLCACSQVEPPAPAAPAPAPSREILPATFSEVYQQFLFLRTPSDQVKAERWSRIYKDRWVRWTGQLVAFSGSGLKLRHLQSTVTFDVSLVVNEPQRSQLKNQATAGKFYTYMARLDRFDDLFRTLYLDQGVLISPTPDGVESSLVPIPPRPAPPPGLPVDKSPGAPGPGAAPRR